MLSNMVRIGKITALDEANARVKVSVSGLETDWLPWGVDSAGRSRKWSPKQVGEQVMLFSPYGDPDQGVVGHSLYQERFPAPGNKKGQEVTTFADGTTVTYDQAANAMTITVAGSGVVNVSCKTATVNAADKMTFNTPEAEFSGHVTIKDGLAVTKDAIITGGDVKADEISLKLHKTSQVQAGNGVSGLPVP